VICDKIYILDKEQLNNYENTLQESLKRLDTDYIDMMMIHWPGKDTELIRANLAALHKAQQKGIIREIGVSNFSILTMEIAREIGITVAANEFGYNLMSRGIEKEILPYCREHNIGVLAYMPLMQGILTGKYKSIADIPLMRRRTVHFSKMGNPNSIHGGPGADAEVEALLAGLKSLSEKTGHSCGALSIAWLTHQEGVACVIAGCRNIEQLHENMASMDVTLSAEVIKQLNDLSQPIYDKVGEYLDMFRGSANPKI
jgi:aryl-alcohol dehydrogenase-like predicted oxidoreductase